MEAKARKEDQVTDIQGVVSPLKWVGGKRRLLGELLPRLPENVRALRYVEPCCGGASLFFALEHRQAVLSDINDRLIETLRWIRRDVESVIRELEFFRDGHSEQLYRDARDFLNHGALSGPIFAAVFIYLNKAGFNGLYRENACGEFNVPWGKRRPEAVYHPDVLRAASRVLQTATLCPASFEETLAFCGPGDFVYVDPPYHSEDGANFTSYSKHDFDEGSQRLLHSELARLDKDGVPWMLSNSDTGFVRELYARFRVEAIVAPRSVGATTRESARELIVRNY